MKDDSLLSADPAAPRRPDDLRRLFPAVIGAPCAVERGRELHYLDSAASTLKPGVVIDRLALYLSHEHANIHRGAYQLSATATENFERARARVASFVGSLSSRNIVFTRGATESINLVAYSLERWFNPGDRILLTLLEHHSNIVPWQLLAQRRGLKLEFVDLKSDASLDLDDFRGKLAQSRPRLCAFAHVANSFGSVLPVAEMLHSAKSAGSVTLLDAAQSIAHRRVNVQELGCDFAVFSGHKLYGPTGIGALYASDRMLAEMQPFQGGGDMISSVAVEASTWAEPPQKFEAGTPAIAEAIGLGTAVEFMESIGFERIISHERALFADMFESLRRETGVTVYGPAVNGGAQDSIVAFNVQGVHAHDLASVADGFNVQIRAGHHCAMPALNRLGIRSSARASLGMYSCADDIAALIEAVRHARKMLG